MKHPTDQLARLVSGDLHEPRLSDVRAHLRTCPQCQAAYDRLEAVEARLRALPRLGASPDFMQQLQTRIAQVPPVPAHSRLWLPLTAIVVGMLALALSFGDLQQLLNTEALPPWTDLNAWLAWLQQISTTVTVTLAVGMCSLAVGCVLLLRLFAAALPTGTATDAYDSVLA